MFWNSNINMFYVQPQNEMVITVITGEHIFFRVETTRRVLQELRQPAGRINIQLAVTIISQLCGLCRHHWLGVSTNGGTLNRRLIMQHPIKFDDLEVPPFQYFNQLPNLGMIIDYTWPWSSQISIYIYTHILYFIYYILYVIFYLYYILYILYFEYIIYSILYILYIIGFILYVIYCMLYICLFIIYSII